MVRVLHLAPSSTDFQTRRSIEQLALGLGPEFTAEVNFFRPHPQPRMLARLVRMLRKGGRGAAEIIHAWDGGSLLAATIANCSRIVYSPPAEMKPKSIRWLTAVGQHRPIEVVCGSATQRRILVEQGVPIGHCHLIRPGVVFSRFNRSAGGALRRELGFAETDCVMLAPGESTRAAAHRDAVWATSILHVLNPKYRLLLWGRGERVEACLRLAHQLRQPDLVIGAEGKLGREIPLEDLATAADIALVPAQSPVAVLPVCICMAAGLPIVSRVTYTVAEVLEDRHTALLVPRASARALAQRVLDLEQDASLRWRLKDAARAEAYEFFPASTFLDQWRTAYARIASGSRIHLNADGSAHSTGGARAVTVARETNPNFA